MSSVLFGDFNSDVSVFLEAEKKRMASAGQEFSSPDIKKTFAGVLARKVEKRVETQGGGSSSRGLVLKSPDLKVVNLIFF